MSPGRRAGHQPLKESLDPFYSHREPTDQLRGLGCEGGLSLRPAPMIPVQYMPVFLSLQLQTEASATWSWRRVNGSGLTPLASPGVACGVAEVTQLSRRKQIILLPLQQYVLRLRKCSHEIRKAARAVKRLDSPSCPSAGCSLRVERLIRWRCFQRVGESHPAVTDERHPGCADDGSPFAAAPSCPRRARQRLGLLDAD